MRARAERLANASALSQQGITHEYRRLSSLCAVRISSFERKQFANLSHAASKAMNLNSYLGLIGRSFPSSRSRWKSPRVYALNLLLVPVSIHGVFNSFRQWWTGRKPLSRRTPKICERTGIPIPHLLALGLIPLATMAAAILDLVAGGISVALIGVLNAIILAIGAIQFVGVRDSFEDVSAVLSRPGTAFSARIDAVVAEEDSATALE